MTAATTAPQQVRQACPDETMQNRMQVYSLLARLFRKEVDDELLVILQAGDILETDDPKLTEALDLMRGYLASEDASTLDLARDYARTFCGAGSTKKNSAYPFESVYTSEKGLLMQEARDGALAWYHRFGLGRSETWTDCEDHIALELEFMAYLIGQTIEARQAGDETRAAELACAQCDFVHEHLVDWVPMFARDGQAKARTDFYRGLCLLVDAYVRRDNAALKDALAA